MADRHKAGRELLLAGARSLRERRSGRSKEAFQAALTIFGGPDLAMGRAHALRGLGESAAASGERGRAMRLLAVARREYQQVRELMGEMILEDRLRSLSRLRAMEAEAVTLVIEANVALRGGDVATAHARVNDAYPLFKEVGSPPSSANLWDATAQIASWEGRHQAAMRAWRKALTLLVDLKDPRARCVTSLRLVEAYLATSRLKEAHALLEDAAELSRDFDEARLRGRVYLAWGNWHAHHDAFEAALDAYEDAQAAFTEAGDADEVLNTQILGIWAASRSGRMEVVERLREFLEALPGSTHPTALGQCLAVLAEHASSQGRPDLSLLAVASARQFWGNREPVNGHGPLLRMAMRALAELGNPRAALTVVHHLASLGREGSAPLQSLKEGWRRQVPEDWLNQVDGLKPETLREQSVAVIEQEVSRVAQRVAIRPASLGTIRSALELCDRLGSRAASVAVKAGDGPTHPMLAFEEGLSERQHATLLTGVTGVGRALANDLALPWEEEVAEVHCLLYRDDRGVRVMALKGGPEVVVDGAPVDGERPLTGGERLEVGGTILRLIGPSAPARGVVAVARARP